MSYLFFLKFWNIDLLAELTSPLAFKESIFIAIILTGDQKQGVHKGVRIREKVDGRKEGVRFQSFPPLLPTHQHCFLHLVSQPFLFLFGHLTDCQGWAGIYPTFWCGLSPFGGSYTRLWGTFLLTGGCISIASSSMVWQGLNDRSSVIRDLGGAGILLLCCHLGSL